MLHVVAENSRGLLAIRFFLGVFEAPLSPGLAIIVAMWYQRSEQPLRHSLWYLGSSSAGIIGGFLSFGIGHVKSIAAWKVGRPSGCTRLTSFSLLCADRFDIVGYFSDIWRRHHRLGGADSVHSPGYPVQRVVPVQAGAKHGHYTRQSKYDGHQKQPVQMVSGPRGALGPQDLVPGCGPVCDIYSQLGQ